MRLFVALRPPPQVRAALAPIMAGIEDARWQTDNQIHLTLAFLGELDRHQAQAAADALGVIRFPALHLRLATPGVFDAARPGRIGTLWIGVEDAGIEPAHESGIAALARAIRMQLRRAGLPVEARKFLPHITLARFGQHGITREALRPWLSHAAPPAVSWQADQMHLVASTLGREGAHYNPVASYPLTG